MKRLKKITILIFPIVFIIAIVYIKFLTDGDKEKVQYSGEMNVVDNQQDIRKLELDLTSDESNNLVDKLLQQPLVAFDFSSGEPQAEDSLGNGLVPFKPYPDPDIKPIRIKSLKSAREGLWQDFVVASSEIGSYSPELLTNSLIIAIKEDAPLNVFEELLNMGAEFQPYHANFVVLNGNVGQMKKLINLGLDIHGVTNGYNNPINVVLMTFSDREMMDFLLTQDVPVRAGKNGVEPLTYALDGAKTNKNAAYFAYKLIKHQKSSLTEDQISLLQDLKTENPTAYRLLELNLGDLSDI